MLAMKANVVKQGADYFFKVSCAATDDPKLCLKLMPILSFADHDSVLHDWTGPLHAAVLKADRRGLCAKQRGRVRPLAEVLALRGFPGVTEAGMRSIAAMVGAKVKAGGDMFDVLTSTIKKLVPAVTEEQLLDIVQLRCIDPSIESATILASEVSEAFGKDQQQVETWAANKLKEHENEAGFRARVKNFGHKLHPPAPAPKAKAKAKAAVAAPAGGPAVPDDDEIDEDSVFFRRPWAAP